MRDPSSYREEMEEFVRQSRELIDQKRFDVLYVFLANYGPQFVDRGADLDRLYDENERLKAIVNVIEVKAENEALKQRLAELEASPINEAGEKEVRG